MACCSPDAKPGACATRSGLPDSLSGHLDKYAPEGYTRRVTRAEAVLDVLRHQGVRRASGLPLYIQIAEALEAALNGAELPMASALPSEHELSQALGALSPAGRAVLRKPVPAVLEGDPAGEVLRLAQTRGADLVIAGARGVSMIEGLLVGSVADRLLRKMPCSVLLVH